MPRLTIIVPTYDRSRFVTRAVRSALAQSFEDLEVVVVDDGSPTPPSLPRDPRVRLLRLDENRGHAAARNAALRSCESRWVTFLDDDDELLPDMARVSIEAAERSKLPAPVGVLSGIETVDHHGRRVDTRLPPTLPRGSCFALEPEQEGKSFLTKQTLVIERATLLSIGGFDERFRSRVHTELFLRLNPVCSLQGIERVTYRRYLHEQPQLSRDVRLRQESFRQLVEAHASVLRAKPKGYARMLTDHARKSREMGQYGAAAKATLEALRYAPIDTARRMAGRSFIAETLRQGLRRLRG